MCIEWKGTSLSLSFCFHHFFFFCHIIPERTNINSLEQEFQVTRISIFSSFVPFYLICTYRQYSLKSAALFFIETGSISEGQARGMETFKNCNKNNVNFEFNSRSSWLCGKRVKETYEQFLVIEELLKYKKRKTRTQLDMWVSERVYARCTRCKCNMYAFI